jgi:hypothetical protein
MQVTLKSLGDNLKKGASTTEFAEPVNKVIAYYVHQQEQLKGFEKNSLKLTENLKIINGWLIDARALAASLAS